MVPHLTSATLVERPPQRHQWYEEEREKRSIQENAAVRHYVSHCRELERREEMRDAFTDAKRGSRKGESVWKSNILS